MLASILIIAFSAVLLIYWFRYSCLLLLRNEDEEPAAVDSRFDFAGLRNSLKTQAELGPLQQLLDRDYRLLTYLLQHGAGLGLDGMEDRLLVLDYKAMRWYYRLTRNAAPAQARYALTEMVSVLAVLGHKLGVQAGAEA